MSDVLSQEEWEEIRTTLNSELESHFHPDTKVVGFIIISADDRGTHDSLGLMGNVSPATAITAFSSAVIKMGALLGVSPRVTARAINAGAALYSDSGIDGLDRLNAEEETSPASEVLP